MSDFKDKRQVAINFAEKHIAELSREEIDFQDTAVLCDGKLRQLRSMCAEFTGTSSALAVAQSFVKRAAMELAAHHQATVKAGVPEGWRNALQACVEVLERVDVIRHIEPEFPALDNAKALLSAAPASPVEAEGQEPQSLTDEQIIGTVARIASGSLNMTRMHELGGKTTTIMDEQGVIEFARAILVAPSAPKGDDHE